MRTSELSITVLEPSEGKTLTNGQTYSKKVYLGSLDSVENWYEVLDSEVPEEEQETDVADTTSTMDYAEIGKILIGE